MEYVDLVIVDVGDEFEQSKALCKAPSFSHLMRGDKVMFHTSMITVIASDTFTNKDDDSTTRMILDAFGKKSLKDVPKLTARVEIIELMYDWEGGEKHEE